MYISSLKIKNFKCFNEVTINFDPNFNLIIGGNNCGKSTIFEALRLWQHAFNKFLKDRTNNQGSSFYATQYFSFTLDDISFLRIENFDNLFFNKAKKSFEILVTLKNNDDVVELPIEYTLTTEKLNLRFELCKVGNRPIASEQLSTVLMKTKGSDFKESMLFTYISPIFHLPLKEPCFQKGYIINRLHQAKANEVIRNLIHPLAPLKKQLKSNPNKIQKKDKLVEIENALHEILTNTKLEDGALPILDFSTKLENEDVFISVYAKNTIQNTDVEINQLGSGTLNILNILAVLAYGDFEKFDFNALLLDEPDSHLHSNHQIKLFNFLKAQSVDNNKQIFIITHNHELIENAESVLFVDLKDTRKHKKIDLIPKDDYYKVYKEIAPDYHKKMIEIAEKRRIEVELGKLKQPTVYCEGTSDVTILKQAFQKLYDKDFFNGEVNIIGGGGEGEVGNKLKNTSNYTIIGILDNDHAGQNQQKKLSNDHRFSKIDNIHFQNNNNHLLMLPIPQFRLDSAHYFEKKTFIEYLFTDDVLENKLNIELKDYLGETFKRFDEIDIAKHKAEIVKNIDCLDYQDFIFFIPLFEKIAEIIKFTLPDNTLQ